MPNTTPDTFVPQVRAHSLNANLGWLLLLVLAFVPALQAQDGNSSPAQLRLNLHEPFRFVVYGDTRFTDPSDTQA